MSTRDVIFKIIRALLIIALGLFVFTGLVLGACFLLAS